LMEWRMAGGNWSTRRKPAPAPLCPPQTPPDYVPAPPSSLSATRLMLRFACFVAIPPL
jgi:hypothetical protein